MIKLKFSSNTSNGLSDSTFCLYAYVAASGSDVDVSAGNLSKTKLIISPYKKIEVGLKIAIAKLNSNSIMSYYGWIKSCSGYNLWKLSDIKLQIKEI